MQEPVLNTASPDTPVRIAIDAMGGDKAPDIVIRGAALAVAEAPQAEWLLVGDEAQLAPLVSRHMAAAKVKIIHTDAVVGADEKPSAALRSGKTSSMRLAIDLVKQGKADAVVSAGNTGALMVMALMVLKSMEGIDRPAMAAHLPTQRGRTCMLDLGATIDCSADHLVQFALMGHAFARVTSDLVSPSIGLLNVGEEEQKGNTVVREASAKLAALSIINYVGFIEGDDITSGAVDVVVTDGFTGNVALKTAEGTARFIRQLIRDSFQSSLVSRLGYLLSRSSMNMLRQRLDPQRYNGAVFLGLNGIVVKSHGGADARGFANALGVAINMHHHGFISDLKSSVEASVRTLETVDADKPLESIA